MSYPSYLDISRNIASGLAKVSKFGRNASVGTTAAPVCINGVYRTPQVGSEQSLRVRGGNANDTANGTGARSISLEGLDAEGKFVKETIPTNGASNGALSTTEFLRVFRCYIAESGTYASSTAGSHAAAIIVEDSSGNEWAQISATNFPEGQSLIAAYSVPLGFHALINGIVITVDGTKTADLLFFQRQNILETAAPYTPMRLALEYGAISGTFAPSSKILIGPFPALTDLGFMARVSSGNADVSAAFDVTLVAGAPRVRELLPMDVI